MHCALNGRNCQHAAIHMHSDIIHIQVDEVKNERCFLIRLGGTIGLLKPSAVLRFVKAVNFVKALLLFLWSHSYLTPSKTFSYNTVTARLT